jgi:microsomal dipeptidase-like Zn-dependent dipeptidase
MSVDGGRGVPGWATTAILAASLALACSMSATPDTAGASANQTRYSLVNGCYGLRADGQGKFIAREGDGFAARAGLSGAEPIRMQATDLGRYLLYASGEDFIALSGDEVVSDNQASSAADWTVRPRGEGFTLTNRAAGRQLALGAGGALVSVPEGAGRAFVFKPVGGCAVYPEVEVNATGPVRRGPQAYGEVSGLVEGHLHHMAFEFLGGRAHCGKPWDRFGAPYALRDCLDHEASDGCGAVLENALYGEPARCHDPVGWPTFAEWPDPKSLTHEQTYYKWVERAWRGGQRIFVNLLVENRVLCELYPLKQNSCNEMDSVLLQAQRARELQDYIDAQYGGPGKGWYRIVRTPFQARRVINQGKLAVVLGMEVSEPFDCRIQQQNTPAESYTCDEAQVDEWLDRLHGLGVRQLEVINKFDNPISGVAGDGGSTGVLTSGGNFLANGSLWEYGPCEDPENHDRVPAGVHNDDLIIANGIDELAGTSLPPAPIYPDPGCNMRGLDDTDEDGTPPIGSHAMEAIMDRRMIFDPDHMSVVGRDEALDMLEARDYPGIISSHSWSTKNTLPRIYKLGGVITPYAGSSESFVHQWEHLRQVRKDLAKQGKLTQYWGVGFGADMNGFGAQGGPRNPTESAVTYPFKNYDGTVTFRKQRSGERVFDINTDGVAHYGLYPDWVEDLRMVSGSDRILKDMGRGAEAYLQMWERTYGIGERRCGGWARQSFDQRGLDRLRLGARPRKTLRRAGQPKRRARTWAWCGSRDGSEQVIARFDGDGPGAHVGLVGSTLESHSADGVGPGDPARRLRDAAPLAPGILATETAGGRLFAYGVRGGDVTFVAVASRELSAAGGELVRALRALR